MSENNSSLPKNPNIEEAPKKVEVDISQDDWKNSNGPIFRSELKGIWYCTKCKQIIPTAGDAGSHAKNIHHLKTVRDKKADKKEPETERKFASPEDLTAYFRKQASTDATVDSADLALQMNAEEEALHIRDLIKNTYINFYYAKARDERKIFPDWTMADCLREGFLLLMNKLGLYVTFGQDLRVLEQDKFFANQSIKIAEAWRDFEAEKELEKAKGIEVTVGEEKIAKT